MSRTGSLEWKATVAAAVAERKIKGFQQPTSAKRETSRKKPENAKTSRRKKHVLN